MKISTLLHRYADYNVWANTRFAEWLSPLPAEVLHREVVSSFSTLRKTLEHNFWAEFLWTERLHSRSFSELPFDIGAFSDADFFQKMLETSAALRDEIKKYDDDRLGETCHYFFLNGTPTSSVRAEMIQHCLQHSTFHRGQVVTLARQLGVEGAVPSTDFIVFTREA